MSDFHRNVCKDNLFNIENSQTTYSWNISKKSVHCYAANIIEDLFSKKDNNMIFINKLSISLNKLFKKKHNIIIKRNNQPKSLCNFIKLEFRGIEYFINNYLSDIYKIVIIDNMKFVKLKTFYDSWVFIGDEDY